MPKRTDIVPHITTLTAALAAAKGIAEKAKISNEKVCSLQEFNLRCKR